MSKLLKLVLKGRYPEFAKILDRLQLYKNYTPPRISSGKFWKISPQNTWSFHATGLFLYPLKTSENHSFSDGLRGYRKRAVVWNELRKAAIRYSETVKSSRKLISGVIKKLLRRFDFYFDIRNIKLTILPKYQNTNIHHCLNTKKDWKRQLSLGDLWCNCLQISYNLQEKTASHSALIMG